MTAASGLAAAALDVRPAAAQAYGSQELIEAAKKEGSIVYYTADFTEPESEIIKAFNKRFPFVKVEMVRAPGGQLITRIKTEAAAGKLAADVVNHSDRGLMQDIEDVFQDYTAAERRRLSRRCAGRAAALAARPRSAGRSPTTPSLRRIRPRPGWIYASLNTGRRRSGR